MPQLSTCIAVRCKDGSPPSRDRVSQASLLPLSVSTCAPLARSMGRTATPQKKTPTTRTLSRASPAPLNFDFGHTKSTSSSSSSTSQPANALPSHLMAGQKRSVEDSPTSSAAVEEKKRTKRAKGKPKWSAAQKRAAKVAKAAASEGEGEGEGHGEGLSIRGTAAKGSAAAVVQDELELSEKEDGEVVEGDFSDLFFMDSAPSAVPAEAAFVEDVVGESGVAAEVKGETEMARLARERAQEEEDMKVFANEVAMERSSDDSEEESDEEDEEGGPKAMPYAEDVMYEDEEALQAAIRGKIVDDSAAKVR